MSRETQYLREAIRQGQINPSVCEQGRTRQWTTESCGCEWCEAVKRIYEVERAEEALMGAVN